MLWLVLLCACAAAWLYRRHALSLLHTMLLAKKIPGPAVTANLFLSALDGIIPAVMKQFADHGPVVRLWIGPFLIVMIKDPDDMQRVLGDSRIVNRDGDSVRVFKTLFGESLITLQDDTWRAHKKLIGPAFNVRLLQTYVSVFGRKAAILAAKLDEACDGRTFDIHSLLALCTLDAICETAIGTAVNTQMSGHNDLADKIDESTAFVVRRFPRIWYHLDALYDRTAEGKKAKENIKVFHSFSKDVIAKKLQEFKQGLHSPSVVLADDKMVSSFLEMLIEASDAQGSLLSPEDLRDEVIAIAMTGIGGPTTTMSMFFVLMAMHPEIQEALQAELDEVFGSDPRAATSEDFLRLPFLDRCIKETMRMFPVCPFLHRHLKDDLQLASGYVLPAGCKVILVPFATHRDAQLFPDPLRFWPDRWLPENVAHSHPYAYLPFSAGVRNCIGRRYADLQVKSTLSKVFREYRVSTKLDIQTLTNSLQLALVLAVKKEVGYPVQVTRRTQRSPLGTPGLPSGQTLR